MAADLRNLNHCLIVRFKKFVTSGDDIAALPIFGVDDKRQEFFKVLQNFMRMVDLIGIFDQQSHAVVGNHPQDNDKQREQSQRKWDLLAKCHTWATATD